MGSRASSHDKPAYPIESVDKALTLLSLFVDGHNLRVSDASTEVGVARSTAHRLLAMLQYHGYVEQDPTTKIYRAGPELLRLGLISLRKFDIRNVARPHIERLKEETSETIHLVTLHGSSVLFLDSVESPKAVRVASRVGEMMLAHCTSAGKAILAAFKESEVLGLYPLEVLEALTPHSIRDRAELLADLERIRARGYATSNQEAEVGVGSIGVPIADSSGRPVASISVSAPVERLNEAVKSTLAHHAQTAAELISSGLDH